MFNNLRELITTMPDETACRNYLIEQRWKGKPVCPYCLHDHCYVIEGGKRFKCGLKTCHKKFSVTVGTFMEASNLPLTKWLMAVYMVTANKKGISSYSLGRQLGIAQKNAWFMIHRIRETLRRGLTRNMENIIEADEMYVGGSIANKHISVRKKYAERGNNWQENKTTVLGIIERDGEAMAVAIQVDPHKEIMDAIRANINPESHIVTDTSAYYTNLSKSNYTHSTVNHSGNQFKVGNSYTNTVEGMFSHFKRSVYGIYHQISPKHTQRYLDEFLGRWNTRKITDPQRFELTFRNMERPLPYKVLIADKLKPVKETKNPSSRTYTKSKPVIQLLGDEVIGQYDSGKTASLATGISAANISGALKGKRKTAGGYRWIFA